jgi:5'-3' exonuclease
VRGIGEKTAAALVAKYGSLDAILAARDLPGATARKIAEGRDYLAAARTVVPPVPNVPIPDVKLDLPAKPKDADRLAALAEEHGLSTPIERVRAAITR